MTTRPNTAMQECFDAMDSSAQLAFNQLTGATMKTSKITHTPGPWTVQGYAVFSTDALICNMAVETRDRHGNRNHELVQANARLIAAAPELLTALRALEPMWDDDTLQMEETYAHEIQQAEAALAHAEGR